MRIVTEQSVYEDTTNSNSRSGFNDTIDIYLYTSLILVILLVCLKGCLVYTTKKKQRRDAG